MAFVPEQRIDVDVAAYLAGAQSVVTTEFQGQTIVYALGGTGAGLSVFRADTMGNLTLLDQRAIAEPFAVGVTPALTVAQKDGGPILLISGLSTQGSSVWALSNDGSLGDPVGLTGLEIGLVAPHLVSVDGQDFLYSVSNGQGLICAPLLEAGQAGPAVSLMDTEDLDIAGVTSLTSGSVGGQTFLFAASATEGAVTALAIQADGTLLPAGWVGMADGVGVSQPVAIEFVEVGGASYIIAASQGTGALTVLSVADDGTLDVADHVIDSLSTRFAGTTALATAEADGHTFVAAGGSDDGKALFVMTESGRLVHLESISDQANTSLQNTTGLGLFVADGKLQVVALGTGESGMSRLSWELAQLGLVVEATNDGDAISGGSGADILVDGAGEDTLQGGAGADLFVLLKDGVTDTVLDFDVGIDRLDLSDQWLLNNIDQVAITQTTNGAELRYGGEVVVLVSSSGAPIMASDLSTSMILNVDRPVFFAADQTLIGDASSNQLTAGLGNDHIEGGLGEDTLSGRAGDDMLWGGAGFDVLYGNAGADQLWGGAEADQLWGGEGADILMGEAGRDTLFGGLGDDTLSGGDLDDVLYGGDGVDTVDGDAGDDQLWGEFGDDILHGGTGDDMVRGGWNDDIIWGGLFNDVLYGDIGNDILFGDAGLDILYGGGGADILNGGGQGDVIIGGAGADRLIGEGGADRLEGGDGIDWLNAGSGDDVLLGGAERDRMFGGDGDDRMLGGTGDDRMEGGSGNDDIHGGAGFDRLTGGTGNDILRGDFNADTFIFEDGFGQDEIVDFAALNPFEKIDLSGVTSIVDWADLSQNHLAQVGNDTVLTAPGDDQIILRDVLLSDLDASDFLF